MQIKIELSQRQVNSLIEKLKNIEPKISRKILREESRRSAKTHLLPHAKSKVPNKTGRLRRSLKVVALKRSNKAVGVRLALSAKKFPEDVKFYGGFIEYGAPKRNVKAVGFMRNTVNEKGEAAVNSFLNNVKRRIDEVI